ETVRRDVAELVASELDRRLGATGNNGKRCGLLVFDPILSAPIFIDYFIYLTYLFRHQNPSSRVRDWGQNLAVLLLTLPALLGLLG
ncbi:unnamed protein product, partial [Durusdinium trenchii]